MTMTLGEMLRAKLMMADLRDAMEKPKAQEAQPAPAPVSRKGFQVTNNLNRVFFEHVKHNPGTRKVLLEEMVVRGFNAASVYTLIGQMTRQGLLQKDDEGVLHLTVSEYTPVKSNSTLRKMEEARAKAAAKEAAKAKRKQIKLSVRKRVVEEVQEEVGEKERPVSSSLASVAGPIVRSTWNASDYVASLTVVQAQELYAELKKIFGGDR